MIIVKARQQAVPAERKHGMQPPEGLPPINGGKRYSDGVIEAWTSRDVAKALDLIADRRGNKGPREYLALARVAGAEEKVQELEDKLQHLLNERDSNEQASNGQAPAVAPDSDDEPAPQEQPPQTLPQQVSAPPPRINGPLLSEEDKEVRRFVYYYRQNFSNWPTFRAFLNGWLQNKGYADPDAEGMMPLRKNVGSKVRDCEERKVLGERTQDDRVTLPEPEDDIYYGQDWL
jgi:hypothetical protein